MNSSIQSSKHKLFCYNCYNTRHISKHCPKPVLSYGIICYFMQPPNIHHTARNTKLSSSNIKASSKDTKLSSERASKDTKLSSSKHHSADNKGKLKDTKAIKAHSAPSLHSSGLVTNDTRKYLMVQRKYSFAFVGFVTGKYNIDDDSQIQLMFNRMTRREHKMIANSTFEMLWGKLWEGYDQRKHKKSTRKDLLRCNLKFEVLRRHNRITGFIWNSTSDYLTPEWYFPKGKKCNQFELEEDCAIREFEEETQIAKSNIRMEYTIPPFTEKHSANEKLYQVRFYVAEYIGNCTIEHRTYCDNREIGNAAWLNIKECMQKIRPYEFEKIQLLNTISSKIK